MSRVIKQEPKNEPKSTTSTLAERYLDQLMGKAWHEEPVTNELTTVDRDAAAPFQNFEHSQKGDTPISISSRGLKPPVIISPFWVFLFSPIPILNSYIQQNYGFGYFQLIQIGLLGIFSCLSFIFFQNPTVLESAWIFVTLFAAMLGITSCLSWFWGWATAMKTCEIVDPYERSDMKLVLLFGTVFMIGAGYWFTGPVPHSLIQKGYPIVKTLEKRGFHKTGSFLQTHLIKSGAFILKIKLHD